MSAPEVVSGEVVPARPRAIRTVRQPEGWAEAIASEVIETFVRTYEAESFSEAVANRARPLYRARFEKALRLALDRQLDRRIAADIESIL